jgi:hypothetical protein
MASIASGTGEEGEEGRDRRGGLSAQGRRAAEGRLRVRTLVVLRWLALVGQAVAVVTTKYLLGIAIPIAPCLALIGVSAIFNLAIGLSPLMRRTARPLEASGQLAFDILQLAGLLWLTGGIANPFRLLLIAPVTVGAATLPARHAVALVALAIAAVAWRRRPTPANLEGRRLLVAGDDLPDRQRPGGGRRHHVHQRLRLSRRQRGPADGTGAARHRDGAGARTAAVGPGRPGGGRRARAGNAPGDHRRHRQGTGPRESRGSAARRCLAAGRTGPALPRHPAPAYPDAGHQRRGPRAHDPAAVPARDARAPRGKGGGAGRGGGHRAAGDAGPRPVATARDPARHDLDRRERLRLRPPRRSW